jgi:hypothetical protein
MRRRYGFAGNEQTPPDFSFLRKNTPQVDGGRMRIRASCVPLSMQMPMRNRSFGLRQWRMAGVRCALLLGWLAAGTACNPFAPAYDPYGLNALNSLGDPTYMDGFFRLFKSAYELRDTALYGRLFWPDFTFAYYDADQGQEISWDRGTEINTAYNLFQQVQQINLDWNFYVQADTSGTEAMVVRNFNLTIVQNENSVFVGSGRARLRLRRAAIGEPWRAFYWFDDSDF